MRMRAEYTLGPGLRFLANLDTMHMMERALRRARLPFALSEGFNPHIRLSMGTVLPVGLWGLKEYFDIELDQDIEPDRLQSDLNRVLPVGVEIKRAAVIPADAASLMKIINCANYGFIVKGGSVESIVQDIMRSDSLTIASRGKKKGVDKDIRKGIYKIDIQPIDEGSQLNIWAAVGEPVNVRYDELMDLLMVKGIAAGDITDVFREGNYIYNGQQFLSPLEKGSL